MSNSPLFIVGANRSGTTLLRLILNAHSRIAIPDELIYFGHEIHGVPISDWQRPALDSSSYAALVDNFLSQNCSLLLKDLDAAELRSQILASPPSLRKPYATVLQAWADHHGKARWGEKTPGNLFFADYILEMFPSAQFVYVVRDPRAGVASMERVSFFPDDVVFNALTRRKHWKAGHQYLRKSVPQSQRVTIQYEDLVQQPEVEVRQVCEFLGEAFEPEMLRFHEDADKYMREEAANGFNDAATRPISDTAIDSWRKNLTQDEIATVEFICGPEMKEQGYPPLNLALSLPQMVMIGVKWTYWSVQSMRNSYRNFMVKSPMFARLRYRLGLS